ncbi:MAG: polysaccharide biosynthesis/export family protein [Oxalobacteraceae bacterium]|nr:polysaccharide biosynthesis/export family protein [Oxalobacteraceae bacterium]
MDEKYVIGQDEAGAISNLKPITPQLLQTEKTLREQQPSQDISQLVAKPTPYLIGSGDILSIVVWDHPELSTPAMSGPATITVSGTDSGATPGFVIDPDGLVQFPYVGNLKLAGLTEAQARNRLTTKLAEELKKPDLTLRVQAYRSKRIYISGEVKAPGAQSINDIPMTLMEALNRAGGFLPSGDQSQIRITRAGTTYQIDLPRLLRNGISPASILLANGDMVRIASREESKIFVLGDVTRPISLMMRDGRLTLNEALGDAGGLNPTSSNGRQVYVVRNATDMEPVVYHLDAQSPVALALAENFELKAKDVVYVDAAPLARWNRVISLILPSALSVTSAVQAVK